MRSKTLGFLGGLFLAVALARVCTPLVAQTIKCNCTVFTTGAFNSGTSGAPAITFSASPTKGWYYIDAATWGLTGNERISGDLTLIGIQAIGNGVGTFTNTAQTTGIRLQFAGVPTISSGFGTAPAVVAGSTDTEGTLTVGTGPPIFSGIVAFQTTWTSAPRCTAWDITASTIVPLKVTTTTTTMTITALNTVYASDQLSWHCVGTK